MDTNEPFIITISRQFGSGGRYIGQQLTKRLGIDYIDNEILGKAADEFSVAPDRLQELDEKLPSWWEKLLKMRFATSQAYYVTPKTTAPTSEELFKVETEIMKTLTIDHSAVVIGRCGYYVFRDHPNCIKIFIHGDMKDRIQRIQALHNVTERMAQTLIEENDNRRESYMKKFAKSNWWDARQFDLTINSSTLGVDKTVDYIIDFIQK